MLASAAVAAFAVASSVLAGTATKGDLILGVGGVVMGFLTVMVRQVMKMVEKKFLFEPYIHQDKN